MRVTQFGRKLVVLLSCGAILFSGTARAVEPTAKVKQVEAKRPLDLKLNAQSELAGQLVNAAGKPQAGQEVILLADGEQVARTETDKKGRFVFASLKTGVYQVMAPDAGGVFRVWQSRVAPPAARDQVMLVQGAVVRGQHGGMPGPGAGLYDGKVMRTLSNPWVFAGVVAAGVAIPIAVVANDDDGEGS